MKKYHVRNNIQFCRYGTLSTVSHEHSWQNPKIRPDDLGFHSPPCKSGMYAFVYPFIEKFLLSASSYSGLESPHPKVTYLRDKNGAKFAFKSDTIWEKSENILPGASDHINLDSLLITTQKDELSKFFNKETKEFHDFVQSPEYVRVVVLNHQQIKQDLKNKNLAKYLKLSQVGAMVQISLCNEDSVIKVIGQGADITSANSNSKTISLILS